MPLDIRVSIWHRTAGEGNKTKKNKNDMKALRESIATIAIIEAMMSSSSRFDPDARYDLSMRKRDVNKPRPDAKKQRKRKLQKEARKINRKK